MLLVAEGFDDYENSTSSHWYCGPYDVQDSADYGTTTGTNGGTAKILSSGTSAAEYFDVFFGSQTNLIVGFNYRMSSTAYAGRAVCAFRAWSSAGGYDYVMGAVVLDSRTLKISYNNSYTNYIATGSTLSIDTWYHIEVKFMLGAQGSIEVRLNGVTDCSVSGINTNYGSVGYVNYIVVQSACSVAYLDDLIIMNLLGNEMNDWLGPTYILRLLGSSIGSYNDFTLYGALTKDELVQQSGRPTTLSNYCYASKMIGQAIDARQSFVHQTLSASWQVVCVIQAIYGVQHGTNINSTVNGFVTNGVDTVVGANELGLMSASNNHWEVLFYSKAPDGGSWTPYKLNNVEFGIRVKED